MKNLKEFLVFCLSTALSLSLLAACGKPQTPMAGAETPAEPSSAASEGSLIRDNGVPENPVNTLGYLKTFFTWMPRISEALDLDEKKREKWLEIAENLAPYPKGTIREIQENPTLWKEVDVKLEDLLPEEMLDKEIYYDEGIGGKWSFHFPGNVMQIYPGNAIGLGSEPEELEVARNTVQIHALVENALGELEYRKALEEAEFADKDNANNLLFNSNGELENGERTME